MPVKYLIDSNVFIGREYLLRVESAQLLGMAGVGWRWRVGSDNLVGRDEVESPAELVDSDGQARCVVLYRRERTGHTEGISDACRLGDRARLWARAQG